MTTPIEIMNAGKLIADAVAALAGLAKGAVKAEEARKIEVATRDVQDQVYELHSELMAEKVRNGELQLEVSTLKADVRKAQEELACTKRQVADLSRYRLVEVGDVFFCYAVAEDCAAGEPAHWICPNCLADGEKSILRTDVRPFAEEGGVTYFRCARCKLNEAVSGVFRPRYA